MPNPYQDDVSVGAWRAKPNLNNRNYAGEDFSSQGRSYNLRLTERPQFPDFA
jgi:hypothetical protein